MAVWASRSPSRRTARLRDEVGASGRGASWGKPGGVPPASGGERLHGLPVLCPGVPELALKLLSPGGPFALDGRDQVSVGRVDSEREGIPAPADSDLFGLHLPHVHRPRVPSPFSERVGVSLIVQELGVPAFLFEFGAAPGGGLILLAELCVFDRDRPDRVGKLLQWRKPDRRHHRSTPNR